MKTFACSRLGVGETGSPCRHGELGSRAFTLIELLVTMAVLTIIVALLTQVFSGVTANTSSSTARIQTSSDVRNVMDRTGADLEEMARKGDYTLVFKSNVDGGFNDSIAFLSNVRSLNINNDPTVTANTRMAGICYVIANASADVTLSGAERSTVGTQPMLMRAATPFLWTDDLTAFTPTQASSATPAAVVSNNFQTFNPDIFRLEIYFQLADGTLASTLPFTTSATAGNVVNLSIVKSIHFSFAVLDQQTRKEMTRAQITSLCGDPTSKTPGFLQDFVASSYSSASSTTPVTIWTNQITATPIPTGLASVAVKAIHFYERSYDLQ